MCIMKKPRPLFSERLYPMLRPLFAFFSLLMASALVPTARAGNLICTPSATPVVVHGEGITERTSDIVFNCSGGTPSATMTVNFTFFLNVNVTNRLASRFSDDLLDISFTADIGSGPEVIATPTLIGQTSLVFNGASFTTSPTGSVILRLSGLRGAAAQL